MFGKYLFVHSNEGYIIINECNISYSMYYEYGSVLDLLFNHVDEGVEINSRQLHALMGLPATFLTKLAIPAERSSLSLIQMTKCPHPLQHETSQPHSPIHPSMPPPRSAPTSHPPFHGPPKAEH
jgi:hypothetical protein